MARRELGRRELAGVIFSVLGLLALAVSLVGGSGAGGHGSTALILVWLGASAAAAILLLLLGRAPGGAAGGAGIAGGVFFAIGGISTEPGAGWGRRPALLAPPRLRHL